MGIWRHLSVTELKALRKEQDVQIVDTRDPGSFAAGHIAGATLLNDMTLEQFLASADKKRPVVVCCYHGHSSQNAADFLANRGFAEVYSLNGGYTAWSAGE